MRRSTRLLLGIVSALSLAACSHDSGHDDSGSSSRIDEAEEFNQADVDFATDMIQHHAQALVMVDLTAGRELSAELTAIAEQIQMAQAPEIETMVDFLDEWDQPIPETVRDHVNGGHGDDHGDMVEPHGDMPGMASADDLESLEQAEGAAFEQRWIELMIEHHEGAVEMSRDEQADGEYPAAIELAETIETAQREEIEQMEDLLAS